MNHLFEFILTLPDFLQFKFIAQPLVKRKLECLGILNYQQFMLCYLVLVSKRPCLKTLRPSFCLESQLCCSLKIKISICKIKDNISFQGRLRYAVMGRIFYKDFKTLIKENISKSNTSVKNMFVPAQGASRPYFVIAQRQLQLSPGENFSK